MGQDGLKGFFPDNFNDFFADQLFRRVAEHARKGFAHKDVTKIGTATREQKWRVAQNSLSVVARCHILTGLLKHWARLKHGAHDGPRALGLIREIAPKTRTVQFPQLAETALQSRITS
jgi:hypothetical protein